jgi:hypothetical protein
MVRAVGTRYSYGGNWYSRSYLLFCLFGIVSQFGGVHIAYGSNSAQAILYGATKNLPNKELDENLPCATRADRMITFNNGDNSESRKPICPEFSRKSSIDNGDGSVCAIGNNTLVLTMDVSTPIYLPDPGTFSAIYYFRLATRLVRSVASL